MQAVVIPPIKTEDLSELHLLVAKTNLLQGSDYLTISVQKCAIKHMKNSFFS